MNKCAICLKITDKCCALCRKVFYCCTEHQEVHWHMSHKFDCEGKPLSVQQNHEDFKIYGDQLAKSLIDFDQVNEESANQFLQLFEQRLQLRKHLLTKFISLRENNVVPAYNKQLIKEAQQLHQLSKRITDAYKHSLAQILEQRGLITNAFIVKMDELLDKVFLGKCYQACSMQKQLKQILLIISNQTEAYPQAISEDFSLCYKNLLSSIIDVSELANLDRISEKMFALYIKLIERFEGIWEQVYAYFNMGMWYAKKTYNQKALKCFIYSVELIQSHKTSKEIAQASTIFKGDAMYNIAISRHLLNQKEKAFENMQQAYKLRCQGLGKSSIQASSCLLILAKWCLQEKKHESCLQFVMECYRIRKDNAAFHKELNQVVNFILKMYQSIKRDKEEYQKIGDFRQIKYFDKLLQDQESFREVQLQQKQSFTKRLLDNQREIVVFKLVVSPELADTLSSHQWSKIGQLIDLIDTKMQKQEAIRIIFQSQFSQSLDEDQRNTFIKLNKLI